MEAPPPPPPPPGTEGAPPESSNLPATFAGRYPPTHNALAAERFRREQRQWYTIRSMWDDEGLLDVMNNNWSQRIFYQRMRTHVCLTAENYDDVAPGVWQAWKAEHPMLPKY